MNSYFGLVWKYTDNVQQNIKYVSFYAEKSYEKGNVGKIINKLYIVIIKVNIYIHYMVVGRNM